MRPDRYARTSWPLSRRTRNWVPGRASTIVPSICILPSSLARNSSRNPSLPPARQDGLERKLALFVTLTNLTALQPSNGFLFLNPAQLAFGDEPALAADRAQHTALNDLFPKA